MSKVTKNGKEYHRIRRKVGKRINKRGEWVVDYRDFYGSTKKEAEQKYLTFMQQNGKSSVSRAFGELIESYIQNFLLHDSSLKESTKERYIQAYRNNLQNHPIARRSIEEISGLDLQQVYNQLTCGASTVRALHKLLSKFYRYAVAEGIVGRDCTVNIVLPKVQKRQTEEVEVWTKEELQKILIGSEGHRLHFLFVLAIGSGLRISELLAVKYSDIKDGILTVNRQVYPDPIYDDTGKLTGRKPQIRELKTESSARSIPLRTDIQQELDNHRIWQRNEMIENGYRTDYIFTTSTGHLYRQESLRQACRRFYNRIGVTYRTFHVFRHTFASQLALAGVPIQTVSKLLGHSNISVTSKYYLNIGNNEKEEAVKKLNIM